MGRYTIGKSVMSWGGDDVQTITFIVTEDCNLRCKYCYITHKSNGKVLDIDVARKFIDFILETDSIRKSEAIVLEFIGGEPLLEAELIDQICDYFKIQSYKNGHNWYWNYRINITTNGINYSSEPVQKLINKNKGKIGVGITIDGTKEKHDLQRVFPNGEGSYETIMKNLDLWLKQFPGETKVTFASADLSLLKESIIHLWKLGIQDVAANVVYENVWEDGDEHIFEEQLLKLADYIIENDLYDLYTCTLFDDSIGMPYKKEDLRLTSCGAGKMIALSPTGDLYPCMRYYDYSLNHKNGYIIGNVDDGIDMDKVRVFETVMYQYQSDEECLECPVAQGCGFCQGLNYDEADTETNFQRTKYICKMHKARVRANQYYFNKLYHMKNIRRDNPMRYKKELLFLLSDDFASICSYHNYCTGKDIMSDANLQKGLQFAFQNFYRPILVYGNNEIKIQSYFEKYDILFMLPAKSYIQELEQYEYCLIFDEKYHDYIETVPFQGNIIFNINSENISILGESIVELMKHCNRINLNVLDYNSAFNFVTYEEQLKYVADHVIQRYREEGVHKEINVLTDILFMQEHEGCQAGNNMLTYAPDGKIYICPAFYAEEESIGNIDDGILIKNQHLLTGKYMPLCNSCDTYQCENCKYINKKHTKEVNVSPAFQCKKAHIERKISRIIQDELNKEVDFPNELSDVSYYDPIYNLNLLGELNGYYKENC